MTFLAVTKIQKKWRFHSQFYLKIINLCMLASLLKDWGFVLPVNHILLHSALYSPTYFRVNLLYWFSLYSDILLGDNYWERIKQYWNGRLWFVLETKDFKIMAWFQEEDYSKCAFLHRLFGQCLTCHISITEKMLAPNACSVTCLHCACFVTRVLVDKITIQ